MGESIFKQQIPKVASCSSSNIYPEEDGKMQGENWKRRGIASQKG